VLGGEDEVALRGGHLRVARTPALQHPEVVRDVPERRIGGHRLETATETPERGHQRGYDRGEAHGLLLDLRRLALVPGREAARRARGRHRGFQLGHHGAVRRGQRAQR